MVRVFRHLLCTVAATAALVGAARAATEIRVPPPAVTERPQAAILVDHLCTKTMRPNEGDRLLGIVSLTARSTIKYDNGIFSPDLIDDAVQNSLAALLDDCGELTKADDPLRLGLVVNIATVQTTALLNQKNNEYSAAQLDRASAADLSEELTSREIDAWLDALPPPQRALAAFLYASDVTPADVAAATGIPLAEIGPESKATKTSLLKFFRQEGGVAAAPPAGTDTSPGGPTAAISYEIAGPALVDLLTPGRVPGWTGTARVAGISSDLYSGWSLLATVTGLPAGVPVTVTAPFLLQPDAAGGRRMLVAGIAEISDPAAHPGTDPETDTRTDTRRFLLKAYSIDADKDGAGWRDTLRLADGTITNPAALTTLANPDLSAIEKTRCLAYAYGTAPDPGLCR